MVDLLRGDPRQHGGSEDESIGEAIANHELRRLARRHGRDGRAE
jgi:hypothetical protein